MEKSWYDKKKRKKKSDWLTINSSKIDYAYKCLMCFYLMCIEKVPKSERITPFYYVKGGLWHRIIEHFEDEDRLGTFEEFVADENDKKKKASEKKKYYDAKSFSDFVRGQWMKIVNADRRYRKSGNVEKLITWSDENQPYKIRGDMIRIAQALFPILIEQGKPLFSELKLDLRLEGLVVNKEKLNLKMNGKIDEIRIKEQDGRKIVVVRDYKTGNPWISQSILDNDPQFTFYNFLICNRSFKDENFAKMLGLENVRHQFNGNPFFVYPEIEHEYFMVEAPSVLHFMNNPPKIENFYHIEKVKKREEKYREAYLKWENAVKKIKTPPQIIYTTRRDSSHFFDLIRTIKNVQEMVYDGTMPAQRKKDCDMCDVRPACEKRKNQTPSRIPKDKSGNFMLEFARHPYDIPIETGEKGLEVEDYIDELFDEESEDETTSSDALDSLTSAENKYTMFDFRRKEAWKGRTTTKNPKYKRIR